MSNREIVSLRARLAEEAERARPLVEALESLTSGYCLCSARPDIRAVMTRIHTHDEIPLCENSDCTVCVARRALRAWRDARPTPRP